MVFASADLLSFLRDEELMGTGLVRFMDDRCNNAAARVMMVCIRRSAGEMASRMLIARFHLKGVIAEVVVNSLKHIREFMM